MSGSHTTTFTVSESKSIFCTFQFEGFHRWPEAPYYCKFLANLHRHIFHARVEMAVTHDNRDVEFITLKNTLLDRVDEMQKKLGESRSCEMMCEWFINDIFKRYPECAWVEVEVSEDGENGARIRHTRVPA